MRKLLDLLPLPIAIPHARAPMFNFRVQLYRMPLWSLRKLSGDAMIVFAKEDGYLGTGVAKYIRDKADYRLDDRIKELGPIPRGGAVSIAVKRLPVRRLIIANPVDDRERTTRESFAAAFDSACLELSLHGLGVIVIADPTEDWNYFTDRTDASLAARWILDGVIRNRHVVSGLKVLVPDETNYELYAETLSAATKSAPNINDGILPA